MFMEMIEAVAVASFLKAEEKIPYVKLAIRKSDVLKIFLHILWETKSLNTTKYIQLSEKLNEIGKNLGGWVGKLLNPKPLQQVQNKQNSPSNNAGEK